MELVVRFIRIYTPFICTLMALLNGVLFIEGHTSLPLIDLLSSVSGYSVVVVLYMFSASTKMCLWYKANLLCLLMTQICGITYNYLGFDQTLYVWVTTIVAALGVMFFLLFRIMYNVTSTFGCYHRY